MKEFDTNSDVLKRKYIEKFVEEEYKKKIEKEEIFSNFDYINWLCKILESNSVLTENDWLYFMDKFTDDDKIYFERFNLFFEGIKEFAENNYIYPTMGNLDVYYVLKYNDNFFKIGVTFGQGASYYCEQTDMCNYHIDFVDIIEKKSLYKTVLIKEKLNRLSNAIQNLIELGVPIDAIVDTINVIKKEQEDKTNKKTL